MNGYEEDPLDLRAQEKEREERNNRNRILRDTEKADLKWLMDKGRGRRIIWRLLEFTGPTRDCFDRNALTMAWLEGNRNVGNFLVKQIMEVCPDQYVLMLKELQPKDKNNGRDDDGSGHNSN